MAVYNNKTEQWKPFATSAQKGKSNSFLVNDGTTNYPIFYTDWSIEKFRNTSGFSDISYTFDTEIVTAAKHQPVGINVQPSDNFVHPDPLPETFNSIMRGPEYIYFSYWLKIDEETAGTNNVGHCVFSLQEASRYGLYFYVNTTGQAGVMVIGNNTNGDVFSSVESTAVLGVGDWHHILVKTKRSESTQSQETIIGDDNGDPDFAWHANTDIYFDGVLQPSQITDIHLDSNHGLDTTPMVFQVGGAGYAGIDTQLGNGNEFAIEAPGFNGGLGPLTIYIGEASLAPIFYHLEKFGAVHQHSGIHSHPEKTMRKQLDRNVRYAAHFGGLDANHSGLGDWKYTEDTSSWVDPNSIPYLELAGADTFLDDWRSPSKSVFYSEDLDDISNLGFEFPERVGSTALYQTAVPEPTGILPFDEGKKIGPIEDTTYADRVVIEIPLDINAQAVLGQQSSTLGGYPVGKLDGDKHVAYYNFSTGEFDLLESGSIGFSAGQGVGLNVDIPLEEQVKNVCRPTSAFGFPATENYQQSGGTLKLSDYLSDAFILEGYELELDSTVSESSDFSDWHVGHGWYLYQDVTEENKYHNPLGLCIPLEGTHEMDSAFENSFGTKIITSFLLKQGSIKPLLQKYEEGPASVSSIGFDKTSATDRSGWDAVQSETQNISSLNSSEGIAYGDISTQRELITYGQTVIFPGKGTLWYGGIDELYPPAYDGDPNNVLLLASIPTLGVYSLEPLSEALSDREQFIDSVYLKEQRSLEVNINQVVDVKSNNVIISSLPFREYQWFSDFIDPYSVGVDYLADPQNEKIQFNIISGTWAGGHNVFDEVESRATTGVAGAINAKTYETKTTAALVDTDFDASTGEWQDISKLDVSQKHQFTVSEPVQPQEGYILYPEDELILGVQNSVSEKLESVQYIGDPSSDQIVATKIISTSSLTIDPGRGVLRLFGRYKREDKFQTPTQNFSLYHNIEANEAIGSEDIRDEFELEPLMSYQGSMRDDIVAPFDLIDNVYRYDIEIDSNLSVLRLISNPGIVKQVLAESYFNGGANYPPADVINSSDFSQLAFPSYADTEVTNWPVTPNDTLLVNTLSDFNGLIPNDYRDGIFSAPAESTLGFLTADDNKLAFIGNNVVAWYKGGNNIRELTSDGYTPPNTSVLFGTNFVSRNLSGTAGKRKSSAVSLTKMVIPVPVFSPQFGPLPFTVNFLIVVVDSDDPPQVIKHSDGSQHSLALGNTFYFDADTDEFYLFEYDYSHSVHSISRHFIVAASGPPESDTRSGTETYHWIDESNVFTFSLFYYQLLDFVYDILNDLKSSNPSFLIDIKKIPGTVQAAYTSGLQLEFPNEERIRAIFREYEDLFVNLISSNSRFFKVSDTTQTNPYNPLDGTVSDKFYILDNSNGSIEYLTTSVGLALYNLITIDWTSSFIPNTSVIDETLESDSFLARENEFPLNKIDRKVIARTTELTPKTDIFGDTPGEEEYGGGYRSAGALGSLKKVQSHTMLKPTGTPFAYEDSLLPEITSVNNINDMSVGTIGSTGWIHIDTQNKKKLGLENIKSDPTLTWIADTQSGTNSFPTTGLYERLSISRINQDGVEWPYSGYTEGVQDENVNVVSDLTHEFPEIFDGVKTYTNLWFGLGSMPDNRIKVFPRTAEFLAWSQSGPVQWSEEMKHEPIRGVRYGMMNTSPIAPTVKFSSRSYGQPKDLMEGILDSPLEGYPLSDQSYGSPVQVVIYSASNFGVLKGDGTPKNHGNRSNIDDFQRVYYPWIDDVLYWAGEYGDPKNILPGSEIPNYRRNNVKINQAIILNQEPNAEASPITSIEIERPVTESTTETSRVDLLGSIKSKRVKRPGSLRSKITKR